MKKDSTHQPHIPPDSILCLKNIGTRSVCWLKTVGIHTRGDLAKVGAREAWRRVVGHGFNPSPDFLFALEGALRDVHRSALSSEVKAKLEKSATKNRAAYKS
jgi:hypothetical protein